MNNALLFDAISAGGRFFRPILISQPFDFVCNKPCYLYCVLNGICSRIENANDT